jgi:4'-phosphopantetheinyl transferase EntD
MADAAEVLKSALSLKAEDRAALAEKLLASLDDLDEAEADRLWAQEATRRRREFQAGRTKAVEALDVAKKAEKLFR